MSFLLHLLLTAHLLEYRQAPAGAPLHIRLTTTVGSYASKVGSPVRAVVIAPVLVDGQTLVPAGAIVSGTVKSVKRVGWGIVHETAAIGLDFTRLILPSGDVVPLSSRVAQVDNGRERVTADGVIRGARSTGSLCYRTSGYIRTALQWEFHAALASWFIKTMIVQLPEAEIYYPAGVELTLKLTQPLALDADAIESDRRPVRLSLVERVNIDPLLEELPYRTYAGPKRPSDIVNVLFLGTREELSTAFEAAGWLQAHTSTMRSGIHQIRAVAEGRGYRQAPMSSLFVNNVQADVSWEKGFNDASKRDHIRIWRQPELWHGRELWLGAATRDVDFAFFRPGQRLTHRVERNVDQERDKVVDDLVFTNCVDAVDRLERAAVPRVVRNATGDQMTTDARVAVLRLNSCMAPRMASETEDQEPIPVHGGRLQRFVRREILSMRSDLIRTNMYYRAYEGTRWVIEAAIRRHRRGHAEPELPMQQPVLLERAQNTTASPAGAP